MPRQKLAEQSGGLWLLAHRGTSIRASLPGRQCWLQGHHPTTGKATALQDASQARQLPLVHKQSGKTPGCEDSQGPSAKLKSSPLPGHQLEAP